MKSSTESSTLPGDLGHRLTRFESPFWERDNMRPKLCPHHSRYFFAIGSKKDRFPLAIRSAASRK